MKKLFKWKHYQSDIIILCVRWYLKYPLSYRNLQEIWKKEDSLYIIQPSTDGTGRGFATACQCVLVVEYSPK